MRVAIRVDSGPEIGIGHLMRCLALAESLKNRGAHILFICRDRPGAVTAMIEDAGFRAHRLKNDTPLDVKETDTAHAAWLDVPWETDCEETAAVLAADPPWDWLIADHYALDWRWENRIRSSVARIMVVDDIADRRHDCDLLLDQNLFAEGAQRYRDLVGPRTELLLGPCYALLRAQFAQARRDLRARDGSVRRLLVMFGGADPANLTDVVVRALASVCSAEANVDVVVGTANPHREEIERFCRNRAQFALHVQVEGVAELMASADLAIGGGGISTWERCCLGLPALAIPIADNQIPLLRDAALAGLVYQPHLDATSVEEISTHIVALQQNPDLLTHMSRLGLEQVDGKGADRAARRLMRPEVVIRQAVESDCDHVLRWRNDPITRSSSRHDRVIGEDEHRQWFEQSLQKSDRVLLIGCANRDRKEPIGVVRFDVKPPVAEVSFFLVPEQRGRGLGSALLDAGMAWIARSRSDVRELRGEVLEANVASHRIFQSLGYRRGSVFYTKAVEPGSARVR